MLRSVKGLYSYSIRGIDGVLGRLHDLYFDKDVWRMRYMVVDTGGWLPGRKVLFSLDHAAIGHPDWASRTIPVELTKEQVENSPDFNTEAPLTRRQEKTLHTYYGWPIYWGVEALGRSARASRGGAEGEGMEQEGGNHKLRSSRNVIGTYIRSRDGEVGHVEDFVVDDENWVVRYMVVDTRNWLPGKKVLIAPPWISDVSWTESRVYVDLTCEEIKDSPEFNPSAPVNREYEERLYDYYGRPKYWL